ncbi:MAG: DoxX family protein [Planctomycetota bacterium]|jgi:putative oxidoreductase
MSNQDNPSRMDCGLLLMRLALAFILIHHGGQKMFGIWGGPGLDGFGGWLGSMGVPMPSVSAFLAASAEFFGGIALLLGIGVRLAAIPASFTLFVGAFMAHTGVTEREYPLSLAIFLLALVFTGGGSITLRNLLKKS